MNWRGLLKILVVLAVVAALALSIVAADFLGDVEKVEPPDGAAFEYPYYLLVPGEARRRADEGEPLHMLVVPNNTGRPEDDFSVHVKAAFGRVWKYRSLAEDLEAILLVPVFPRLASDWRVYTHALDRDSLLTEVEGLRRFDLQLLAMIDHARERLGDLGPVQERVILAGFSANGMFANRFTVLHPERVLAAAVGSPGGWPIVPVAEHAGEVLRYPVGVADVKELSGRSFQLDAYKAVPHFFYVGAEDDNDSLQYGDGWDEVDRDLVYALFGKDDLVARWREAQALYESAGCSAEFKVFPGAGHDVTSEMRAEVAGFLRRARDRTRPSGG